ncbi:MAG TPA: CAP domain-containing protein [Actinomycetota bacterium]|nr:CAP domain-containing protein [Actinomycetota bacterium]
MLPVLVLAIAAVAAPPAVADTVIPVPGLPLTATIPSVSVPVPALSIDALEAALGAKLNAERAGAGLQPLARQPWASSVAREHSQEMAAARNIWHNHAGYLDIARQTIDAYVSGENVAEAGTLDEADALLTASPLHRANILYPLFNYVGIGVAIDTGGYVYVTQDFVDIKPTPAPIGSVVPAAPAVATVSRALSPPAAVVTVPAAVAAVPRPAPATALPRPPTPTPTPAPTPAPAVAAAPVAMGMAAASGAVHATETPNPRPSPPIQALPPLAVAGLAGGTAGWGLRRRRARSHTQ